MKALVIGGTGNISSFFIQKALKNKIKVEMITRNSGNILREIIKNKNLIKTFLDINNISKKKFLKKLKFKKYDFIINFICYDKLQAKKFFFLTKEISKKIIIISTTSGYLRNSPKFMPLTEKSKFKTNWKYAKKKMEMEKFFLKKKYLEQININIIRLGHTYGHILPIPVGPTDWTIPYLIKKDYPLIIHDDGKKKWSLLHSEDAANAIILIAKNSQIKNDLINVVSSNKTTWNSIAKILLKKLKYKKNIKYINSNEILKKCRYFGESVFYHKKFDDYYNTNLLKKIIPTWKEKITLEKGIEKTVNWFMKSNIRTKPNKKSINLMLRLF